MRFISGMGRITTGGGKEKITNARVLSHLWLKLGDARSDYSAQLRFHCSSTKKEAVD